MRFAGILACLAFVVATTASASADFFTIPAKQTTTGSPIFITAWSNFIDPNNTSTFRTCVSFRNNSTKPASLVVFTFQFNDMLGNPIAEQILRRSGSFGPGIEIEGKMTALGGNSDSFNNCVNVPMTSIQPALETIVVTQVQFEDGTVWKKGDPLPGAQGGTQPTGTGNTGGTGNTSVNVNGAVGAGIDISGGGGTFGTIAWVPGSRKLIAWDLDEQSQTDADYGALSKCNALNGGGTACKVVVRMFTAANRCGAVAMDDVNVKAASARGPNQNDTIKAAQDALEKAGGVLSANSIVTVVCNTK
jgi:hypothetical protein